MTWFKSLTVRGYACPEVASALQKSIRRGQQEQAVYWAVELDRSGYGAYAWRRMLVITSEDVGLSEPLMPANIRALYDTWKELKATKNRSNPERLQLVHAVLLLARARKSRMVDHATCGHYGINDRLYPIPDEALDMHTMRGRQKGRGLEHWYAEAAVLLNQADDLGFDPFERINAMADAATETPLVKILGRSLADRVAPEDTPEQEALI